MCEKKNTFFTIFKGLSVTEKCFRPVCAFKVTRVRPCGVMCVWSCYNIEPVLGKDWLKYLQIRMQILGVVLPGIFKAFKSLRRLNSCEFLFKKCIILRDFFYKSKRF